MVHRADAPILVQGAEHFVERNYREGGRFQWVRETLVNAIEAGATRVEFGTEWQGVRERGIYRRVIADNGSGMTPDQLLAFFRTYGGSGRPIGGIHENYGIGSKCALFPWNKAGVIVVSWHPEFDEPSMIWVRKGARSGQYGLRTWETDEGPENVVAAGTDDGAEIDWSLVKPGWIDRQGTVIVLLGDEPTQDTVLGDPNRPEGGVPGIGIVSYLNRRMWDLGSMAVSVDEYRREDKASWPKSASVSVKSELQYGRRKIEGAKYYIDYPPAANRSAGKIAADGTMNLSDGTKIDWYLWQGSGREGIRNAAMNGFIGAQYAPPDNRTFPELFDVTDHPSRFRQFGISEAEVRRNLWLVARPPLAEAHKYGVYMSSDRNRLLIMGGPRAGDPLPWDDWAIEFADQLPQPIVEAINDARAGAADDDLDESWRDRLAERFGRRWRQLRLIMDHQGDRMIDPDQAGGTAWRSQRPHRAARRERQAAGASGGRDGSQTVGRDGEGSSARERRAAVGLPKAEWKAGDEFQDGIFAIWNPPSTANPDGLVQLNVDHPVLREEILFWAPQYPTHLEDEVIDVIKTTYATLAVATIAHTEALRVHLEQRDMLEHMRSPEALTAALLGLVGPAAIIGPALGGALGRRRERREAVTVA
jgi:hypothetical protein